MNNRADMIVQHLGYLVEEYGFHVKDKEFRAAEMGNAYVVFQSANVGIEVVVDRDQVLMSIGYPRDPRKEWFEFTDVVKYFSPSFENPYAFIEKTAKSSWDEVVEGQLRRLAHILRQHCAPLLAGKPLAKAKIKKIEEERVMKMFGNHMEGSSRGK